MTSDRPQKPRKLGRPVLHAWLQERDPGDERGSCLSATAWEAKVTDKELCGPHVLWGRPLHVLPEPSPADTAGAPRPEPSPLGGCFSWRLREEFFPQEDFNLGQGAICRAGLAVGMPIPSRSPSSQHCCRSPPGRLAGSDD